jgi:ABC-2 type transport system permease protein
MQTIKQFFELPMLKSRVAIAFFALLRKEIRRFLRIWVQTLLPPLITMGLYFLIFGQLIGSRIQKIAGIPYVTYIAPGLIMMAVITNAYANVSASLFSMRFQKSIEELLVAPLPAAVLLLGFVIGGMTRALLVGLLVTLLALFFTAIPIAHFGVLIVIVLGSAMLFSLAGFTNAIFAKNFDDISIIPTFVLTPLTYLGGVFYSIEALPPFWKTLSLLNPLVYIVNAFRYALLGRSDVALGQALIIVFLCCGLLFYLNLRLLRTAQEKMGG